MEFVSECGNCPFGISIYGNVSFIHFLYGTIQLCGMAFLTGFLRLKKLSYDNNSQDIAYPLLPIYNIVIIYCIIIGILVGVESLIDIDQNLIYVKSSLFFAFHSCSEGVAVLLLYRSLGFRAIRNSFLFGISWGFVATAIPTLIYVFTSSFFDYAVSVLCAYVLTTVFYLSLYLLPISFLFRRPALIIYARWFSAMNGILTILFLLDTLQCDTISCYAEMITAIVEFLNPFIVLYALKQDSLYWQGLYTSSDVATLNQPLLGIWRLGDDTISCITETINRLEKKVVPIIPFTQLQLDTSEYFPGGSARVYRGMCQGKEVAIKILFCMELTPESVIAFCEEASLLYSLHHANIVTCYGVSIMPPAVSIVTEFCHFGSLFDFLYNTDIMSDFDFESVAGRSSAQASQMTRGARLAQISENSHSSQISQRSKSNDTLGQKRTQSRANSRKKPSREGDDDASESLLIEYKPSFSIFNYFSWLGKPYQAKHIVTNDRERTNSNSNHQFYDANTGNLDAITQQVYAPQPSQVTSRNNRKSRDDGSASVASFDTVNQSSKASSHEQSQSNNELGLNTATNSTYLLASDTRIRADTSNSLGSIGRVASGRISSGRVSSFNSAESSQLSMSNSLGILHNVTDNSFSPGSSFQLYGTRAESNSYQDTSALAFFVGSSTDGSLEQQRRQAESFSYPIDSNSKSGGLEHMSSVSGYDAYNKEEDGNEDVNVKVTDASMSLNSQKGSIDSYSDHSTATSDFMTTILRANSMQSSLGGSEVGDLLAIDTAATAVSAFDNSASQIPSPDMSNNNSSPVLSTSPVPSPGVQDGNYTEDTNHRIPVSNVLVPAAVVTNKQKKLQVTPPPPRYEARLVLSSSNGANLTRKKTLFLQRITSGSFSRIHSSSGSTGNNGSGSGLMKSNECSDVLVLSETSHKFIESLVDDLSNSVSRLTASPLTSHSGVTIQKDINGRNNRKNEVYRSLVSVMKLFESSEMNFGLGPMDAANRSNIPVTATGTQKAEARVRFMSPAARRGSGGSIQGSLRGSQPGSVRSSRQNSVRGSILGSVRGSMRNSVPNSKHSRWSLESGNIDSLLLSSKYANDVSYNNLSRDLEVNSQPSPNTTGWRLGQTIPFRLCLRMMRDCVAGVAYLHKHDIVHCDIKSLNFLVTKDFVVKLSDLGEARTLQPKPEGSVSSSNNPSRAPSTSVSSNRPAIAQNLTGVYAIPVHPLFPNRVSTSTFDNDRANNNNNDKNVLENGTYEAALPTNINWSPPEVLAGNVLTADKSIDVWGLGMVLSELLLGEVPFDSDEFRQLSMYEFLGALSDGARPCLNDKTAPSIPKNDMEWIESLLSSAWNYEARQRCTAENMLREIDAHMHRGRGAR